MFEDRFYACCNDFNFVISIKGDSIKALGKQLWKKAREDKIPEFDNLGLPEKTQEIYKSETSKNKRHHMEEVTKVWLDKNIAAFLKENKDIICRPMKMKNEDEDEKQKKIRKIYHQKTIMLDSEEQEDDISYFFNPTDLD